MSVSNVAIANIALTMLSANRITSLDQDDESARRINAIYEFERDALLYEHNWNFARKQTELSLLDETPTLGDWLYVYQLPSDVIRVIRMELDYPFAIYSRKLYTNSDSAKIEYVSKITDEQIFSSGFIKAFACRLAMEVAYGITQSATVVKLMADRYSAALSEAKWADAQEGIGINPQAGSFLDSRY